MLELLKAQYLRLNSRDREKFRTFVNQDSIFGRVPEAEDEDALFADSCIALFFQKIRHEWNTQKQDLSCR